MAAIMVLAARDIVPDNGVNDNLKVRKGQPVSIQADGHPIGSKEGLPNFCRIRITDAFRSDLYEYNKQWTIEIEFEVLNHSPPFPDTYTVRAYNANSAVNLQNYIGRGQLTREQVEGWLSGWNATVDSATEDNVVFTATIWDALQSRGFWKYPGFILQNITFTSVNYNPGSGIHTVEADYSDLAVNPNVVEQAVLDAGGTLIDHINKVLIFSIPRTAVVQTFRDEVRKVSRKLLRKKQYYFTDAVVDNIVANGGLVTTDLATFQSYIRNRLTD